VSTRCTEIGYALALVFVTSALILAGCSASHPTQHGLQIATISVIDDQGNPVRGARLWTCFGSYYFPCTNIWTDAQGEQTLSFSEYVSPVDFTVSTNAGPLIVVGHMSCRLAGGTNIWRATARIGRYIEYDTSGKVLREFSLKPPR
jgi:hypothetical protein